MRDPKTGFAVVQALAPAVYYSGASLSPGSYYVNSETRWDNKIDQSTGEDLYGIVTPGPELDLYGFSSASVIVDVGASFPPPADPQVYKSSEFGFGIRLQYEEFSPGSGIWADCYDLRIPFPFLRAWKGFRFLGPNATYQFNIVVTRRKYRLVTMVKTPFYVAAGAVLLKGHPTQRPAV
ncbi:hypothetical protein V5F59_10100 [Xanthobacter autotrophicus DSM 431]|uniref:hypothetical protein n=1 Tax=Xanthobacter nonsaccharivorans TaxID=3119912 RepID=UPI00372AB851